MDQDLSWLLLGPELALGLFFFLILFTFALRAGTARAAIPGLGWFRGHSLYRDLTLGLALLATVPAIAMVLVLISRGAEQRENRAMELLVEISAGVTVRLDDYFSSYKTGIAALASNIERGGKMDDQTLTEWIETHHALYDDFLTMLAANASGEIVTATALVHGQPERVSTSSHDVSDRDYFSEPMRNGAVYVSDVFTGRGLGNDSIIAISAVVLGSDNQKWGIVEGSLNLQRLEKFRPTLKNYGQPVQLLIIDNNNRVVFSSNPYDQDPAIQDFRLSARDDGQISSQAISAMGWTILASIPRQAVHSKVWSDVKAALLWLLAALLTAFALATAIARRVSQPLIRLKEAVRALDLQGTEADISPPPGAPDEIREVFGYLESMAERMRNSYRQLTAASEAGRHYREQLETTLSRRETEIRSRTKELENSNRNLRTLSNIDQLTGLANRRRFNEALDQVWRHAMREQSPVSIVIMDIDHFKEFNDTYGHQDGDSCLAKVGGALSACTWRPLDLVARYGGEEFIMILANTNLPNALAVAERTRRVIEDLAIPHENASNDTHVTLSLGAACKIPERNSKYSELVHMADRALYYAKEQGRNCVAWADYDQIRLYDAAENTPAESDDVGQSVT
ncbi:MAG: diguanylate cyclase [Gammaproteobacteria bacterium]|nr:diguanylate cyclase [Gammaproteobacteria bacterium]